MLRRSSYIPVALVALVLSGGIIGVLSLPAAPDAPGSGLVDAQPIGLVAGPSIIFGQERLMKEPYGVTWSDGIFRGRVLEVTTSSYNTPSGEFSPPIEEWVDDDLVEEFIPHRYFTVTFAVDEWWKNHGESESPVHVLVNGYSPTDPLMTPMPEEATFEGDYDHAWQIGEEAVVFVVSNTFLDREIYQTPSQFVYFVAPHDALVNVVSDKISRSSSVRELYAVVQNNYFRSTGPAALVEGTAVPPVNTKRPVEGSQSAQTLQLGKPVLTVRHDLKGALAWLTLTHPQAWFVGEDQMSGVTITSENPETIASWYGQPVSQTWGTVHVAITDESDVEVSPPDPGVNLSTSAVTVDGYPGTRYERLFSNGVTNAAVVVTVPGVGNATSAIYIFNTQVAGLAAGAAAMREQLDGVLSSIDFISDYTTQVGWTHSAIAATSTSGKGFDIYHAAGWTLEGMPSGGVTMVSPSTPPYTEGPLTLYVTPASPGDAARWSSAPGWPYHMFRHETRGTSTAGLTTPLPFVPSAANLVRTDNGVVWLVAVSNPAQTFGTPSYWFYDQTVYRTTTDSLIAYRNSAQPTLW